MTSQAPACGRRGEGRGACRPVFSEPSARLRLPAAWDALGAFSGARGSVRDVGATSHIVTKPRAQWNWETWGPAGVGRGSQHKGPPTPESVDSPAGLRGRRSLLGPVCILGGQPEAPPTFCSRQTPSTCLVPFLFFFLSFLAKQMQSLRRGRCKLPTTLHTAAPCVPDTHHAQEKEQVVSPKDSFFK